MTWFAAFRAAYAGLLAQGRLAEPACWAAAAAHADRLTALLDRAAARPTPFARGPLT